MIVPIPLFSALIVIRIDKISVFDVCKFNVPAGGIITVEFRGFFIDPDICNDVFRYGFLPFDPGAENIIASPIRPRTLDILNCVKSSLNTRF